MSTFAVDCYGLHLIHGMISDGGELSGLVEVHIARSTMALLYVPVGAAFWGFPRCLLVCIRDIPVTRTHYTVLINMLIRWLNPPMYLCTGISWWRLGDGRVVTFLKCWGMLLTCDVLGALRPGIGLMHPDGWVLGLIHSYIFVSLYSVRVIWATKSPCC